MWGWAPLALSLEDKVSEGLATLLGGESESWREKCVKGVKPAGFGGKLDTGGREKETAGMTEIPGLHTGVMVSLTEVTLEADRIGREDN